MKTYDHVNAFPGPLPDSWKEPMKVGESQSLTFISFTTNPTMI